jgi:hypothetical protein
MTHFPAETRIASAIQVAEPPVARMSLFEVIRERLGQGLFRQNQISLPFGSATVSVHRTQIVGFYVETICGLSSTIPHCNGHCIIACIGLALELRPGQSL